MSKATVKDEQIFNVLNLVQVPKFKTKQLSSVRTRAVIVDTMLDNVDESLWKRGGNFIDPACGRGTFLLKIVDRLSAYHCNEDIVPMIHGIDIDPHAVESTKILLAKRLNTTIEALENTVTRRDFTTMKTDLKTKFDLCVSNPPYGEPLGNNRAEAGNSNNSTFYLKWMEMAPKIADNFIFITPAAWTNKEKQVDNLKENGLKKVEFLGDSPFENVYIRSGLTIFYAEKDYSDDIEVVVDGKSWMQTREMDIIKENSTDKEIFLELFNYSLFKSRFKKGEVDIPSGVKGRVNVLFEMDTAYTPNKTDENQFKLVAYNGGASKDASIVYSKYKSKAHNDWKVLIGVATSKHILGHTRIIGPGHSVSKTSYYVKAKDEEDAKRIKKYLDSELVRYIAKIRKNNDSVTTGKNLLNWIPEIPQDIEITFDNLLEYFNITKYKKYIEGVLAE